MVENAVEILKSKYNLVIVNDNPLKMESIK